MVKEVLGKSTHCRASVFGNTASSWRRTANGPPTNLKLNGEYRYPKFDIGE